MIKGPPNGRCGTFFRFTDGDAAVLLRAPLLGFIFGCFLGLSKKVDLLGDDLAAVAVGTIPIGPFGVMDTSRDHDYRALGDILCDAFTNAVEAGDPVP